MRNPKIIIGQHYEELVNSINIYIENLLLKYKENEIIGELAFFKSTVKDLANRYSFAPDQSSLEWNFDNLEENSQVQNANLASERNNEPSENNVLLKSIKEIEPFTKVHDYLKKCRDELIDKLNEAERMHLEFYATLEPNLNMKKMSNEQISEIVFEKNFYFILDLNEIDSILKNYNNSSSVFKSENYLPNFTLLSLDSYLNKRVLFEVSAFFSLNFSN